MSKKPAKSRSKAPKKAAARNVTKSATKVVAKPATKRPSARPRAAASAVEANTFDARVVRALEAIAASLAGAQSRDARGPSFDDADAFVWQPNGRLIPVPRVSRVDIGLLKGVDRMRDTLIENTERFALGLPANNALLWGARGMGKSSLVKAAHASVNARPDVNGKLKLVEIHREDIETLPALMAQVRETDNRIIVFCDDLSFDGNDASYKSLKAVLEGGIEGRPDNAILYATSNRRHLLARDMIENERSTAINPGEAVEEKVSLSDRFGLWLGFHRCSQDEYLAMVQGYCDHFGIAIDPEQLQREAL